MENKPDQPAKSLIELEAENLYPLSDQRDDGFTYNDLVIIARQAYIAGSKSRSSRWALVKDNRPELGWYLCRKVATGERIPMKISANVICDVAGGCYKDTEIEWLDEGESHPGNGSEKDLKELLEVLYENIPKQDNDHDWWPDELTKAMAETKKLLNL